MQNIESRIMAGGIRSPVMTQKQELPKCRSRGEVMEAVIVNDQQMSATDSNFESLESDGWTEFSHGGKRWSFDSDQLALWEQEFDGFHFLACHKLVKPTIESVTDFIKRHGY